MKTQRPTKNLTNLLTLPLTKTICFTEKFTTTRRMPNVMVNVYWIRVNNLQVGTHLCNWWLHRPHLVKIEYRLCFKLRQRHHRTRDVVLRSWVSIMIISNDNILINNRGLKTWSRNIRVLVCWWGIVMYRSLLKVNLVQIWWLQSLIMSPNRVGRLKDVKRCLLRRKLLIWHANKSST